MVCTLFYRDFIFHPERLIFGSDMLFEGISLRRFYTDEILAGRGVPMWVPHVYGGMPFVGLLPGPIFYPTTLLYLLMPLHRAIGWTFVMHTFLGGAFGYFLARSFRLRPSSAVVCGGAFMLTGYVTSHLWGGQDGRMFGMVLIPLALGCLNRGLESGKARWFCGVAFAIAAQTFTPHTQVMYFSSLALALLFLFHIVFRIPRDRGRATRDRERTPRDRGRTPRGDEQAGGRDRSGRGDRASPGDRRRAALKPYLKPVAGFGLAVAGAVALSGPQLFPTLALLGSVTRVSGGAGYEFAASFALPPQELTAFFLPDLVSSLPGSYWGSNPLKLHTEYLGSVPIALAIVGVAAGFGRGAPLSQRRVIRFLAAASVLGVLFAMGDKTPVHRIAYYTLPLMDSLRAPAMMIGPVTVFVSLLAAYGWEAALRSRSGEDIRISWPALGLLGGPLLLLGAAAAVNPQGLLNFAVASWYPEGWPRRPDPALASALRANGLLLLAGFAVSWIACWTVARRRIGSWAVAAVVVVGVADLWRVDERYLVVADASPQLAPDGIMTTLAEVAGPGERVWAPNLAGAPRNYRPNELTYHGVSSAAGLQKFLLDPYARLIGGSPEEGLIRYPEARELLNVRYVIMPGRQEGVESVAEASGRNLYAFPPGAGYAYFPAGITEAPDSSAALAEVRRNGDFPAMSIVEERPGFAPPEAGRGSAAVVRYEPDFIELDVVAEKAGLLVVSELHDPGWRAFVDGDERDVWRANAALRGVVVPEGRHRLVFEYRSRSFALGVWTCFAALGLAGAGLARSCLRSRRGS